MTIFCSKSAWAFAVFACLVVAPPAVATACAQSDAGTSQLVVVRATEGGRPLLLLGFIAYGHEGDLARLDRAASGARMASQRLSREDGVVEQMILFPPGSNTGAAIDLYLQARSGAFGDLTFEVVVVAAADAADGIDFATEVSAEDPNYIVEPER